MRFLNKLFFGIDLIFYTVFSYYYDNGKINEKNFPLVAQTYFIVSIFFVAFFIFLFSVFEEIVGLEKNNPNNKIYAKIFAVTAMFFTYLAFFYKKRYVKIYNHLKNNYFVNSKNGKRLGWFLYFLGLASPILLSYMLFKIRY